MTTSSDSRAAQWLRRLTGRTKLSARLRNSTGEILVGRAGPVADQYARVVDLPGWFNLDDAGHFHLVAGQQSAIGMQGDLLEIGPYFGRSTAILAGLLGDGETLVVCDAFADDIDDNYVHTATEDDVREAVARIRPDLPAEQLDIRACLSTELEFHADRRFRLIHVDGGHGYETVRHDLELSWRHLADGGVLVIDDYGNPAWPEVTLATDDWWATVADGAWIADLNRHGAAGRKLYVAKRPTG